MTDRSAELKGSELRSLQCLATLLSCAACIPPRKAIDPDCSPVTPLPTQDRTSYALYGNSTHADESVGWTE